MVKATTQSKPKLTQDQRDMLRGLVRALARAAAAEEYRRLQRARTDKHARRHL